MHYEKINIQNFFTISHEIQDGHILKINKTKKIKKLYQIHIFTLCDLLMKLLIL